MLRSMCLEMVRLNETVYFLRVQTDITYLLNESCALADGFRVTFTYELLFI